MNYKIIILVLVILLLGLGGYYLFLTFGKPYHAAQSSSTPAPDVLDQIRNNPDIHSFNLSGKVTQITGQQVSFTATLIQNGDEVKSDKVADLTDKRITYYIRTKSGTGFKDVPAKFTDIKVAQTLTFSTNTYPYDQQKITPYKVVILK